MPRAAPLRLCLIVSAAAPISTGCGDSSTYTPGAQTVGTFIQYTNWSPTPVCEATVHELDEFIEQTSKFLSISPPPEHSITYSWVTQPTSETWHCSDPDVDGCTFQDGDHIHIYSRLPGHLHELVHALHKLAMPGGTQILQEGLAEYLGSSDGVYLEDRSGFAQRFTAMIARGKAEGSDDYKLALQFVGALIETDGIDKFRTFWSLVADSTSPEQYAAAYEATYKAPFADRLAALEQIEVHPIAETYRTTCQGFSLQWPPPGEATWELTHDDVCLDRFSAVRHSDDYIYRVRYVATPPGAGAYQFIQPDDNSSSTVYVRACGNPGSPTWISPSGIIIDLEQNLHVFEVVSFEREPALAPINIGVVTP